MIGLHTFLTSLGSVFSNLFVQPDWRNWVDVGILAVLIYQAIKLTSNTRTRTLFKGIAFVVVFAVIADALQLSAVSWLLQQLINTGVLVVVIVFQPEVRRALDQIGRSRWASTMFTSSRKARARQTDRIASELTRALCNMAKRRVGALIVFERNTGLGDVIESGTSVDAEISQALIENIFEPNTPLHDGAVIVRNERIVAAACILQLSDDYTISRELGTRHRAAIGITESTDAVSLIVSEETGVISMARDGRLTRYLDEKSLGILLHEILAPEREGSSLAATVSEWLEQASDEKEAQHE